MKRVTEIINHPKYIEYMNLNAEAEKNRVFCHHDYRHVVDVARVAYILVLENSYMLEKEIVYAAALLHDIGRWKEYGEGVDHAAAGSKLAAGILKDCGFLDEEIEPVLKAISEHRQDGNKSSFLSEVINKADKISRPCKECRAINGCKRFADGSRPQLDY